MDQEKVICPDCGGPIGKALHPVKACIYILRRRLEESEREQCLSEKIIEWVKKNPEKAGCL